MEPRDGASKCSRQSGPRTADHPSLPVLDPEPDALPVVVDDRLEKSDEEVGEGGRRRSPVLRRRLLRRVICRRRRAQ